MQTATIRDVQHHLSAVLKKVEEEGEVFEVLRRHKPIARIVPLDSVDAEPSADWSSHAAEISRVFHDRIVEGRSVEQLVLDSRGDR